MEHDDLNNQLIYVKVRYGLNPSEVSHPHRKCDAPNPGGPVDHRQHAEYLCLRS